MHLPFRPAPLTTAASPRRYGDYVLLETLGRGGMSEVDLARRSVDRAGFVRFLVIKRIIKRNVADPTFVRMFVDEARINAELQHENIAQVYDFGERDGEWYLAMEYVPGIDLRRLQKAVAKRKEGGALLPPRVTFRILYDVLAALQYAHHRVDTFGRPMRIVHRDVNPRNIMVSIRGEVKLIDFGVAKADNRHDQTTGQTIKGKFAYMAPEQIESTEPVDGRADLFAVGLVLQEMLTGSHPFRHLSEIQIIHRLMSGRIEPMPECLLHPDPAAVLDVRNRALATRPADRFEDARAFQDALVRLAAPLGGMASRAELAGFFRRAAPEATAQIAERLESWRTARVPQGAPALLEVPPDAEPNEDTWASDMRTAEIPADSDLDDFAGGATVADAPATDAGSESKPTVADAKASVPAAVEPGPTAAGDELSASSVVVRAPSTRSSLPVVAAIVVGGGAGLVAIAVVAVVLWMLAQKPDPVMVHASPDLTEQPRSKPEPDPAQASPPPPPDPSPADTEEPPEQATSTKAPASSSGRSTPSTTKNTASKSTPSSKSSSGSASPPPEDRSPPARTDPPPSSSTAEASTPAPEASKAPAGKKSAESKPVATGFLFATSRPSGFEVIYSGRSLGHTPLRNAVLPVGTHTITLRDPQTGQTFDRTVTVVENQPTVVKVNP